MTGTEPLMVRVGDEERPAWADESLVGPVTEGDEVLVNTEALDLDLGSGGFDVVHANLTRGLEGGGESGEHVMKLNYTSLQHPVRPIERDEGGELPPMPVLVIGLHGQLAPAAWAAGQASQLAPAAWAAGQASKGLKIGYVQTPGAALPGSLSRDVPELRQRGLLCGHITAGASYGGEHEAISAIGALDAAAAELGWDAAIAGPGPGILGSATRLGHGGMAALETLHAALALGLPTLACPRLSSGDPRERHRGLSHHTEAVLGLLLGSVVVPSPRATDLEGFDPPEVQPGGAAADALGALRGATERHELREAMAPLAGYAESGLPARTMGRELTADPLFFAAALAAGTALADQARS